MSADEALRLITQGLYVVIFGVVAARAKRRPVRANVDTALLFAATALVIWLGWVTRALAVPPNRYLTAVSGAALMALPYLLLRLVDDFAGVPAALMRAAEAGLLASVVALFGAAPPLPVWLILLLVAYFVALEVYAAVQFVGQARRSHGVTRRRMQAVAAGSLFLGLTILTAGLQAAAPALRSVWSALGQGLGLASGLAYFVGFAPPALLRRAWQEPELRAFLGRAAALPRLPTTEAIVRELERGTAAAVGAPAAAIGLWDPDDGVLRLPFRGPVAAGSDAAAAGGPRPRSEAGEGGPAGGGAPDGRAQPAEPYADPRPGQMIAGRAFASQRPIFSANAPRDDPDHAAVYRRAGAVAVLAAPITAGEQRLGVLCVYAPRAPIFAEDDLLLVQLLADQAAVILESRALIDEAARVRAREESARLKEDFLSAAAHDLKTPLTTLLAQAQLLERRAAADPRAPADAAGIGRLVKESRRLNALVAELLDASRAERGKLIGEREPVDVVEVARDVCARQATPRHPCVIEATEPVIGSFDRLRLTQLVDNLVENAVKYSPDGGKVVVRVWCEDGAAHLAVADHGIGIPTADLPHLFERFHRGANVDDRRFAGMGLGLFISRGIVEEHGGRIWAVSAGPGAGSTVRVALPVEAPMVAQ